MPERDPLDELRAAWAAMQAPDPTPEVADEGTECVVETLRSAWRALEPPPARVPARLRFRLVRQHLPGLARLAAAIVLLVGAGLVGRALLGERDVPTTQTTQARLEVEPPVEPIPSRARTVTPAQNENGIVMTHGKVRLVMLTPEPTLERTEGDHDMETPR